METKKFPEMIDETFQRLTKNVLKPRQKLLLVLCSAFRIPRLATASPLRHMPPELVKAIDIMLNGENVCLAGFTFEQVRDSIKARYRDFNENGAGGWSLHISMNLRRMWKTGRLEIIPQDRDKGLEPRAGTFIRLRIPPGHAHIPPPKSKTKRGKSKAAAAAAEPKTE